jgi:uncharacterized protein YnzC (UPF0291/DUF896 family)
MTDKRAWQKWSAEEEQTLRDMWMTHSRKQMAQRLGRNIKVISRKAYNIGLPARPMTDERKQEIRDAYHAKADKMRDGLARKFQQKPLTESEVNTIRMMRAQGGFIHVIAKSMRRDERLVAAVVRSMNDDPLRQAKRKNPRDDAGLAPLPAGHPIAMAELERAKGIEL